MRTIHLGGLIVSLFFGFSIAATAQHTVSGIIIDQTQTPVDAAVIALLDASNGQTIKQTIADSNGKFSINAVENEVKIYVSCIGYTHYLSQPITLKGDTVLPVIVLKEELAQIENVVIVGKRQPPTIKMEHGKIVYQPKNGGSTAGTSALEVLKKTPGVFIDNDNNISIGGKNGVLITLNGKQTYMQKDELVALLKSTPASSVSTIEIMSNPSARYDAEGTAGMLNINLDKRMADGMFLSVNNGVSYWKNLRQNTEVAFNYLNGRLSVTGNYNHSFGYYNLDYGMHRIQNGNEYNSYTHDIDKRHSISGNLTAEYRLSEHHTMGTRLDINTLGGPGETNTTTHIYDASTMNLLSTLYGKNDYFEQKANRYGGNVYYIYQPKEQEKYAIDFNYAYFDGGSGNMQPNIYRDKQNKITEEHLYKSLNSRSINIYALAYDQQNPLLKGELKTGGKYSTVNADNDYRFYNIEHDMAIPDDKQSNRFKYKEQIAAAYLSYTHDIGKRLSAEIGIRGEYTWAEGRLLSVNSENNKHNYFDWFPSVAVNWQPNKNSSLSFNYSKRIDRPAYQDLNPFEYLLDELSYWKGNPFLSPQKSHNLSINYAYKKTAVTLSFNYLKNYKAQITDTLSVSKIVMIPKNIGTQKHLSLSFYQGLRPFDWWEMNLNLTGYYVKNNISFDRFRQFNLHSWAAIAGIQNAINLPSDIKMELNASYLSHRLGASNEYMKPSGYVDLYLNKSFLGKRIMVGMGITDMFHTNRWDNHSSFSGFELWNWGKGESRQIRLNVCYKFGKQHANAHRSNFNEIERL